MNDRLHRAACGALLAAAAASTLLGAAVARAATLTVTVEGVHSSKGTLRAGAYDTAGRQVANQVVPARAATATLSFDDLAPGRYAVRLYHDENGNGRLDKSVFGLPAEGYGFSNNAVGRFGVPAFDKMAVEVGTAPAATTATLRY